MPVNVNWRDLLSVELVRQIETEFGQQFAEGWAACQRAVATLTPNRLPDAPAPTDSEVDTRTYPGERAPRGFWAGLIEQEAQERFPEQLPSLKETMRCVQAKTDQFRLARSSFNVAIETLERDGKLRRDGKKLFWVPAASLADEADARVTEKSEADSDQELSASAVSPFFRRLNDAAP